MVPGDEMNFTTFTSSIRFGRLRTAFYSFLRLYDEIKLGGQWGEYKKTGDKKIRCWSLL